MSSNSTYAPSHPLDFFDDHRSLLNVVSLVLAVITILIVLTRLGTRWAVSQAVGLDDGLIVISTVLALGQTVSLAIGVGNGLGQTLAGNTSQGIVAQQKSLYASIILFVLSQCFAKISIVVFIRALTPVRLHQRLTTFILAAIIVWATIGVFAFSFPCRLPQPWKFVNNVCVNRKAIYTFVEVFNILLDAILVLLPSIITLGLQIPMKPKVVVIAFFVSRIFVIASSITQLVLLYQAARTTEPFLHWTFSISLSLIQYLGIAAACGPYLKPFLEGINSGMIGSDDLRRRGGTSKTHGSKKVRKFFNSASTDSALGSLGTDHKLKGIPGANHERIKSETFVSADRIRREADWEAAIQTSRSKFIRQTKTYHVSDEQGSV